jgi:transcriptional regulator with XRE-family HTH domain
MPELREFVRHRIRELRLQRGLTQAALCERAVISLDSVTRIEGGTRVPTIDTLERIANALGVSVGDLVHAHRAPQVQHPASVQRIAALIEREHPAVHSDMEIVVRAVLRLGRTKASHSRRRRP